MDTEPSENLWALIQSGIRTFIGQLTSDSVVGQGRFVTLEPAYEVSVAYIPMRGPNGETVVKKEISATPFLLSLNGSPLHVAVEGYVLFGEMKGPDRARYKRLADQAEHLAVAARAADSGIALLGH